MRFKCVKDDFLRAIQISQKAISSRSTLPILSSLLMETEEENMNITGTDLEMIVSCKFPSKISEKGRAVAPARLLGDIIKNLEEETVEIIHNGAKQTLDIKCGKSFFSIKTLPGEDFPKTPEIHQEEKLSIKKETLINIIKQVIKAASKDESRPVLTGVLLDVEKEKITLVATDSYRLVVSLGKFEEKIKKKEKIIIPARALEEVLKISGATEGDNIIISISNNHIMFDFNKTKLISRLIEGEYPDYRKLFPNNYKVEIIVKKEDLIGAVRRMSLLAQSNTPIKFNLKNNEIDISAETQEVGKGEEKIFIEYKGAEINIAFNSQYLLDGLTVLEEEEVIMKLLDPLKPGLIKPVGNEDFLYLIMPVRI